MYLCTIPEAYEIFDFKAGDEEMILYVNMLSFIRKGILGLNLFNPEKNKWGQAHTQGGFVFTMFLYLNQGDSKLLEFEVDEVNETFLIHLDRSQILTKGKELITQLLMHLQVYKSTGDIKTGQEFYDKYSAVGEKFLKMRKIVISKKKPRKLDLYNQLVFNSEDNITCPHYEDKLESIPISFADRFPDTDKEVKMMLTEWNIRREQIRMN
jgi:dipeptidyl-peptidase-3